MPESALRDSQMTMARYLRDPQVAPPPEGVEERRLKVYRDLIYNNIEGFISSGFPVLRSLYTDEDWHGLVRVFIDGHRCHTPYFLEISQEFLRFLMEEFRPRDCDPAFIAELAHYEWVELALDVADETPPPAPAWEDDLAAVLALSPLAWVLSYRFPVHRIGPAFQPGEPDEPTFLAVYRNRDEEVQFMALNGASARLLELVRDNEAGETAGSLLERLAGEMSMDAETVKGFGAELLRDFSERSIVVAGGCH